MVKNRIMNNKLYADIDTLHSLVTSTPFRREVAIQKTNKLKEEWTRVGISLNLSILGAAEAAHGLVNALKEFDQQRAVRKFWKIAQG